MFDWVKRATQRVKEFIEDRTNILKNSNPWEQIELQPNATYNIRYEAKGGGPVPDNELREAQGYIGQSVWVGENKEKEIQIVGAWSTKEATFLRIHVGNPVSLAAAAIIAGLAIIVGVMLRWTLTGIERITTSPVAVGFVVVLGVLVVLPITGVIRAP